MDYSKFGVEDFLCDNSFLEYCLGTNEEAVIFWTEWLKDHPEKVRAADSARSLYYTLNGSIGAESFHADYQVFKNTIIANQLGEVPTEIHQTADVIYSKKINYRLVSSLVGIAACLLIVFGLFISRSIKSSIVPPEHKLSYTIPLGKKHVVRLSDGSIVTLNGGSQLKLSPDFNVKKREVTLIGEGYFVVVHNVAKPFIVHTSRISIKDVGTEFNVKAYPADKTTVASLIKGLIEITVIGHTLSKSTKSAIVITPNNKFVINNNIPERADEQKIDEKPFTISQITTNAATNSVVETDWKENKLTFYDQSFDDIALQMERWYGVKIVIADPDIKNIHFTATFDHENIMEVLEALKLSGNFNYRKEDNVISIY